MTQPPFVRWALSATLLLPAIAHATPHELPYSYPYATLTHSELEIEQYADMTPVPGVNSGSGAQFPTTLRSTLTTEIEYGLTDRLELGLYFQFSNDPGSPSLTSNWPMGFDGVKQRLRYRIGDPGRWPVDVSLYGEVSELSNEVELEAKINLERRLGRFRLLANLWGEHEFYYNGTQEWVLNPTAGATFEIVPWMHVGFEYWMHAEYGLPGEIDAFNPAMHHYLGPAISLQGKRFWATFAPYLRLDNWNRGSTPSDEYGRVWLRLIVGVEL